MSIRTDALDQITNSVLRLETLETRNSDSLDFHELSVWQIREALNEAYAAGKREGMGVATPIGHPKS